MTIKKKKEKEKRKRRRSRGTVNVYINTKAFHTRSNKHKYYTCIHHYQHDTSTVMTVNQKSTSTVITIRRAQILDSLLLL